MNEDAAWWREADAVLDRLLDLPDEQREQQLSTLELSTEVSARVMVLLGGHRRAAGVLERSRHATDAAAAPTGTRLGRWVLEEEIGRGGMAVVYRARSVEEPMGLIAALKLLTIGGLAAGGAERIQAEQRLLARLRHPHIATLIDCGVSAEGTPWFAMALIEGERIDRWCARRALDARARVELLLDVCSAVEYAHGNLVVHRDLKPTNVLVDATGHVSLLDFGIARILDAEPAERTRTHERILTPQYAAPEQFRASLPSTAMDVYGLGALLYSMLTGAPPRRDTDAPDTPVAAPSAILRQAQHRATPRLIQDIRGELDAVVLKALAVEPGRRYPSVGALVADLRRWLAGVPVLARPASRAYRAFKFYRRNRTGVSASLAIVVALVAGALGTLWQASRAREEARVAHVESQRANAVRDFLIDVFRANDPDRAAGTSPDLLTILSRGVERAQQPDALPANARAEVLSAVGTIYTSLGRFEQAEDLLGQSMELWRARPGPLDPAAYGARLNRVWMLNLKGRTQEALEEARAIVDELRQREDVPTTWLRQALFRLSETRALLGIATEEGRRDAQEAVTLAQRESPYQKGAEAAAQHVLAMLLHVNGELEASAAAAERALTLAEQDGASSLYVLRAATMALATTRSAQQRYGEALELNERGLQLTRKMYDARDVRVGRALNNYGSELINHGRFQEAHEHLMEALQIQRQSVGASPRLAPVLFNLGYVNREMGNDGSALEYWEEALALLTRAGASAPQDRILLLKARMAILHMEMGDADAAARLHDQIDQAFPSHDGQSFTPVLAEAAQLVARGHLRANRLEAAHFWIDRSQAYYRSHPASSTASMIFANVTAAEIALGMGDTPLALDEWRQAKARLHRSTPDARYFAYSPLLDAVELGIKLGKPAEARNLFTLGEEAARGRDIPVRLLPQRTRLAKALAVDEGPPLLSSD